MMTKMAIDQATVKVIQSQLTQAQQQIATLSMQLNQAHNITATVTMPTPPLRL